MIWLILKVRGIGSSLVPALIRGWQGTRILLKLKLCEREALIEVRSRLLN